VRFRGTHAIQPGDIVDHIALSETSWIPFSAKQYLDPSTLELDRKRIESIYAAHGYFLARVRSVTVSGAGDDAVDVTIDVDEGPPTVVEKVEVFGLEPLGDKRAAKVVDKLPIRQGEPFVHQRYLAAKGLIHARLVADGYAFAQVHGVARVDRNARTATLQLDVATGARARFGEVTVVGESPADPRLVGERAAFRRGDRFDPERLEATRGRIYELGLFSSVRVDAVPDPRDPSIANVIVTVRPSTLNELRLGGGFGLESDRQEIHLRVLYTRRNFFGGLRTLRLRVQPGWVFFPAVWSYQQSGPAGQVDATVEQPGFLTRDLSLKGVLGYDLGIDYAFRYHGPRGNIGVSYSFPQTRDRLVTSLSYNVQELFFYDAAPAFLANPVEARTFLGYTNPYRLAYLSLDAQLDLRDRPLMPRKGGFFDFSVEGGAAWMGGGFDYLRLLPDARGYLPLGKRVVLAARVEYGRIFTQGDASPITRRFYAGGPDSHRGFNYHRLSPQVPSGSDLPPIPVGGDALFLAQGEARVRIVSIGSNGLGAAVFVDAGDVPGPGYSLDLTRLHIAAGGGLRLQTLIGTLRADLGVRLNRLAPFESDGRPNPDPGSRFAFHLSIGEAF